jgi:hypothetical protein
LDTYGASSASTGRMHRSWVQAMNVGSGIGQMSRRGRSHTLRTKQGRSEFFGELAVCPGREQIVWGLDINHGHWRLQERNLKSLLGSILTQSKPSLVSNSGEFANLIMRGANLSPMMLLRASGLSIRHLDCARSSLLRIRLAIKLVLCHRQRTVRCPLQNWSHPKPETTPPSQPHRARPFVPSEWWIQSAQSRPRIADSLAAY